MIELFENLDVPDRGEYHFPYFDQVRNKYRTQLHSLVDYYHDRVYAVKNTNIVVRLLGHLNIPFEYDSYRYVDIARTRSPYIAKAFKLTSEIEPGVLHPGPFYGIGSKEILFYIDDYFDVSLAEKNWQSIRAIRVLNHPKSDLGLLLPNGRHTSTDTGLSCIAINLPLLALQYRCFFLNQSGRGESVLGVPHFVSRYVLPNMLYRQTDIVLKNRLKCLFYAMPFGEPLVRHPLAVIDYRGKVDQVISTYITKYRDARIPYASYLKAFRTINHDSLFEALQLPDLPPTRQCWWAVVLSRLDVIRLLIDLGGEDGHRANRNAVTRIQLILTRLNRENIYPSILDPETRYDVRDLIDGILAI